MEYIDALNLKNEELNRLIGEKLYQSGEVCIQNPHSMHNIGIGLNRPGQVVIQGSTGFYTGGFMEGPTIVVDGNSGWYTADNMMAGEIIINKNTGSNAGVYMNGGTLLIRGGTGSRLGYGMKGGTIIVCGSAGRLAGQMTMGGKLIIIGQVGRQIGESMYRGVIYLQDDGVQGKLGGNVYIDSLRGDENRELEELFDKYEIKTPMEKFLAVRPAATGRHRYVLFQPELKPESSHRTNYL